MAEHAHGPLDLPRLQPQTFATIVPHRSPGPTRGRFWEDDAMGPTTCPDDLPDASGDGDATHTPARRSLADATPPIALGPLDGRYRAGRRAASSIT